MTHSWYKIIVDLESQRQCSPPPPKTTKHCPTASDANWYLDAFCASLSPSNSAVASSYHSASIVHTIIVIGSVLWRLDSHHKVGGSVVVWRNWNLASKVGIKPSVGAGSNPPTWGSMASFDAKFRFGGKPQTRHRNLELGLELSAWNHALNMAELLRVFDTCPSSRPHSE